MTSKLATTSVQREADVRSASLHAISSVPQRSIRDSLFVHWHLLSLDAPTVAVLWTLFTASVTHTRLPIATPIAMALTVWTLYASDRLLDARHLDSSREADIFHNMEPRHLFHHRYRAAFVTGIAICTIALAVLLPRLAPSALRLYLVEGALVLAYLVLIHAAPGAIPFSRRMYFTSPIPKELLVGPLFAAAVFIPTVSRKPELRLELLPLAILFAALCTLNCLYIYAWEHPAGRESHWTTIYSVRNLGDLTSLFFAASLLYGLYLHLSARVDFGFCTYPLAAAASSLSLAAIHNIRERLSPLTARAAADAALLTPLAILPFLSWHRA